MNTPQNVTDTPNNHSIFTVWQFKHDDTAIKAAFEQVSALVLNLNKTFAIRLPDGEASCVMGVGYEAWIKLGLPTPPPKELKNFTPIVGQHHTAVATPGDLHFHLRSPNISVCIDMLSAINDALHAVADCLEEVHGFRYWDGRSILGFVDGTENPIGDERHFFAVVGQEDPLHAGGSYVFVQKYVHNMQAWEELTIEQQEQVFGRHKISDIEMADDIKPNNSHSALANIEDEEGNELKVVRDNMPFRDTTNNETGTYFIAYANKFSTTEKMLERMFIGNPPGNHDRILDFSIARTGSLFFAPALTVLKEYSA